MYKLVGPPYSPFFQKLKAYLLYKSIPFEVVSPSGLIYRKLIFAKTGKAVVPVLVDENGKVWQDSNVILDRLESIHKDKQIRPTSTKQRFVSNLFEFVADEWLFTIGLYFRFGMFDKTKDYLMFEFGRQLAPNAPLEKQASSADRVNVIPSSPFNDNRINRLAVSSL
ncbi:hypothetical protein BKA69DRAFT_1090529 [Paraphysoderma sedebokerense]|nr:hypothetical protein BKA69DRAFT_1090529 [Paraphysoderma sedebokerense]